MALPQFAKPSTIVVPVPGHPSWDFKIVKPRSVFSNSQNILRAMGLIKTMFVVGEYDPMELENRVKVILSDEY